MSTHRRPTSSECSLRKLKKKRPVLILNQVQNTQHEHDLSDSDIHDEISDQSVHLVKRDTIFIDVTNKDVLPALDFVFAILDAERETSTSSMNTASPISSLRLHCAESPTPSVLSSHPSPRYVFAPTPWKPSISPSPARKVSSFHTCLPSAGTSPFEPQEFTHVFPRTHPSSGSPSLSVSDKPLPIPFPPSPSSSSTSRVPLLQRKPRLGQFSAETGSLDVQRPFIFGNHSNVTLLRSVSALDRHRDCAAYKSTASVNTIESTWSTLLPRRPVLRSPSLKLFLTPRKFRLGTPTRSGSQIGSQISLKSDCDVRTLPSSPYDSFPVSYDPVRY